MSRRLVWVVKFLLSAVLAPKLPSDLHQPVAFAEETHNYDRNDPRSDTDSNHQCERATNNSENHEIVHENRFQPYAMRQITLDFDRNISLDVLEATSSVCSSGADDTGLVIWGPSLALSQYLIKQGRGLLAGKRVVELGCGAALPSMVSHRLGAVEVVATDYRPQTLDQVQFHAKLNDCQVHVELVDWTNPESLSDLRPQIVLAADVIYGLALVPPLVNTIEQILPRSSTLIIATRDERIGIAEFRQMMNVNFVEVQVERSTDRTYLPPMPTKITKDPSSHERWSGKHSIFTYRWRDED